MTLRGRARTPRRSHLAGLVVATLVTLALTGLASLSGMLGSLERASLSTRYSLRHAAAADRHRRRQDRRRELRQACYALAISALISRTCDRQAARRWSQGDRLRRPVHRALRRPETGRSALPLDRESRRSDPGDERERRAGPDRRPRRRREPREGSRARCCRQPRDRSGRRHHELPLRGVRPEEPRGRSRRTRARDLADPFAIRERRGADRLSRRHRRVSRDLVLARPARYSAGRLVPRQDRRRRSNRAKPPRPACDTDERQRTHARSRSAGERHLDGSARQPAPRRARLADGHCRPSCCARRTTRGLAPERRQVRTDRRCDRGRLPRSRPGGIRQGLGRRRDDTASRADPRRRGDALSQLLHGEL